MVQEEEVRLLRTTLSKELEELIRREWRLVTGDFGSAKVRHSSPGLSGLCPLLNSLSSPFLEGSPFSSHSLQQTPAIPQQTNDLK
jgi:hypothetical protein